MSNPLVPATLVANRKEAKILWHLFQIYQNGLQLHEFELAQVRLETEFLKFEQWLGANKIEFTE